MTIMLIILHVIVSIALILVVLLQSGKGAEMGASFGAGGSQSVFGAGGGNVFMTRLTTGAAIIFMLTSLTLAYTSSRTGGSSIMPAKVPAKQAPKPAGGFGGQPAAPAAQPAPAQNSGTAPQAAPASQPAPAKAPASPATK